MAGNIITVTTENTPTPYIQHPSGRATQITLDARLSKKTGIKAKIQYTDGAETTAFVEGSASSATDKHGSQLAYDGERGITITYSSVSDELRSISYDVDTPSNASVQDTVYQYDYGQKLYFPDADLPDSFEVHFSNTKDGEASVVTGSDGYVDIPDDYLKSGDPVYVWLFSHTGNADGETELQFKFNVKRRAKPSEELTSE